jgi:hypothetical protein
MCAGIRCLSLGRKGYPRLLLCVTELAKRLVRTPSTEPQSSSLQMSPNTEQFWSHNLVYDEVRSIATTVKTDTSSGNFERSEEAGSVLTNESVQTNAGDAGSIGKRTIPTRRQLTEDEIESRAYQGFAKLPKVQDTCDLWRHCSYDVERRIRLKARQAEEVLAQAKGESIKQDPHTVPKVDKTSITTDASSSYMGTSAVSSHGVEVKLEIEEEIVPRQSRRRRAPTRNTTSLGLATSASSKRRLDPDETKRDAPPPRRRINNSGKGTKKTRIKQKKKTYIKQEFEDDAAVFLGEDAVLPYKDIVDEASFAQEVSDAPSEEKKGVS